MGLNRKGLLSERRIAKKGFNNVLVRPDASSHSDPRLAQIGALLADMDQD